MADVIRTGISLKKEMLERFDRAIRRKGYTNRSEAIRDLVREFAVAEDIAEDKPVVGTLTLVYDHHQRNLAERLIDTQHHAHKNVLAATHIHLDRRNCLEVIILKGRSSEVRVFADRLLSLKGVKHGRLVMTTSGRALT